LKHLYFYGLKNNNQSHPKYTLDEFLKQHQDRLGIHETNKVGRLGRYEHHWGVPDETEAPLGADYIGQKKYSHLTQPDNP
jgi:hypothetical protein